ncbi:gluconate 2-dehydrogenase subunit 3 family protein [Lacihabitans soyangensis]|uniref:Gluconate 2-dehydrogenase subunit 3 family protein n=1 Tax=Lacihabitans soyangensis TaxID=869394 RepID=A0AAE3H2Y6_9BACT|nr:gluconate 2-dehydrogenase subunit 3 family protein [Lacihabitans soyangensis]MCP9763948.1 gluconate 2-dehydrogenase subunit 3 family protein [Lacihabitans soyangensis]
MNRREVIRNVALMLGGTFSAPTIMAMDKWETFTSPNNNDSSFSLTETQQKILAEIAEMIIPKTDTPGAKDVGVPAFIVMMLNDCYREPEHQSFLDGLASMEKVKFLSLKADERTGVLKLLEQETKKITSKVTPFWRLMKELTLLGYFTSEAGLKASFEYVQIPGKLELIKLKPNQKSFAY